MIESQAVGSPELLARSGAARTAMIALGHDDAVPGVSRSDSRIDGKDAPMRGADGAHHPQEKVLALREDGGNQRAPSPRHQSASFFLIPIGHDGRRGTKHLDLVHGV